MIILESIMDALTSIVSGLNRASPTGGEGPGVLGGRATRGELEGDSGFAGALLSFLGEGVGAATSKVLPRGLGASHPRAGELGVEESVEGNMELPSSVEGDIQEGDIQEGEGETEGVSPGGIDGGLRGPSGIQRDEGAASHRVIRDVGGEDTQPMAGRSGREERLLRVEGSEGAGLGPAGDAESADLKGEVGLARSLSPATPLSAAESYPVSRDLDRLQPEFRRKLERVIHRMAGYGHQAQVVEGYRSPERQEALYEQGRSEAGPVVTWTRESLHSQGLAADLQVDGSWDNPRGYARLQQVAREEGLQTLGAKDPGHLELSAEDDSPPDSSSLTHSGIVPRVSRPARVARTASAPRMAQVAQVARPARPGFAESLPRGGGESRRLGESQHPAPASPMARSGEGRMETPSAIPASTMARGEGRQTESPSATASAPLGRSEEVRTEGQQPGSSPTKARTHETGAGSQAGRHSVNRPPAAAREARVVSEFRWVPDAVTPPGISGMAPPEEESRNRGASVQGREEEAQMSSVSSRPPTAEGSLHGQGGVLRSPGGALAPEGVEAVERPGSVERVQRLQALEETMASQAPSRIHLDIEDADGAGTRLRLALNGTRLAGTVDLADPLAAQRMRARVGELHQALSRRGLDAQALGIHGVRGVEVSQSGGSELNTLLQDPLAGLARVLEARDGATENRSDRNGHTRDDSQREPGGFRNASGRRQEKEDRR